MKLIIIDTTDNQYLGETLMLNDKSKKFNCRIGRFTFKCESVIETDSGEFILYSPNYIIRARKSETKGN